MPSPLPLMYTELADWWPVLSDPADYAEEAAYVRDLLAAHGASPPRTMLELGSGGGNTASHLKAWYDLTLVDRSPGMLAVSRRLNPSLPHVEGDMRNVRLGRAFDAVLIHDAIMYMTTAADLAAALATARAHCRPGGMLVVMPDCVAETFKPGTDHGGHDGPDRALRYLEWSWDPDPADTTFETLYAIALRGPNGTTRVVEDHHTLGLFPRATWLELLSAVGFQATVLVDPWDREVFVGRRRDA